MCFTRQQEFFKKATKPPSKRMKYKICLLLRHTTSCHPLKPSILISLIWKKMMSFFSDSQTERFILSIEEQFKQSHTFNMYPSCPYPSMAAPSSLQFVQGSSSITGMPGQVNAVFNNCTVNFNVNFLHK